MTARVATGIYLSVAANIDPENHITQAVDRLREHVRPVDVSPFYRTRAIGRPGQPDYLNGVLRIETTLEPAPLKWDVLRPIETALGRLRTADKYAARPIDLDLLLFGQRIQQEADLTLPDPDILERVFLAAGLLDLDPDLILPGQQTPLSEWIDSDERAALEIDAAFSRRIKEHILR